MGPYYIREKPPKPFNTRTGGFSFAPKTLLTFVFVFIGLHLFWLVLCSIDVAGRPMSIDRFSIIQQNKHRGNLTWYGISVINGVERRESLGTKDKKIAGLWLASKQAQKFLPDHMKEKKFIEPENPERLLTQHRSSVANLHKSNPRTMAAYDFRLRYLERLIEGKVSLEQISPAEGRKWAEKIIKDLAPKTVKEIMMLAKKFWARMIEDGHAKEDIFKGVLLPKRVKKERAFWTVEEVEQILVNAPNDIHRGFWGIMAYAGLRHAEADALTWGNIDLKRKEIRLTGKGSKTAVIPINKKLMVLLKALVPTKGNPQDRVFVGIDIYPSNRRYRLYAACKGIAFAVDGSITLHRFRHSFASNLLRAGAGIKSVQALMRHESAQITLDTYGHLLVSDLSLATDLI